METNGGANNKANKNKQKQQHKPAAASQGKKNYVNSKPSTSTTTQPPPPPPPTTSERPADNWQDDYLRDYAAKKIVDVTYTVDDCELIVNRTLAKIAGGQATMLHAVKGLVRLAYNTLMDPRPNGKEPEELFFVKYSRFEESWQSSGRANGKEKASPGEGNADSPKIRLRLESATVNQRKAAIGVWAMCHLRAMVYSKERLQLFFGKNETPSELIKDIYQFENPYKFPAFDRDTYELMRVEFSKKKTCDPEVLYLLYRGAIILEHIFHRPELRLQKTLLLRVAYGNPNGLREHGFELYTWFRSAANGLHLDLKQLQSDLTWALCDGPYSEQSNKSVETVVKLMEFHRRYHESSEQSNGSSKYFLYARVVNGKFFSHLDADSNEELLSTLVEICRLKGGCYIPDGKVSAQWKERAQLLAKKICQRHTDANGNSNNNNHQRSSSQVRESRTNTRARNGPNNGNNQQQQQQQQQKGNQRGSSQAGRGFNQRATSVARNNGQQHVASASNAGHANNNHHQQKNNHQKRASSQVRAYSNNIAVTSLLEANFHNNRPGTSGIASNYLNGRHYVAPGGMDPRPASSYTTPNGNANSQSSGPSREQPTNRNGKEHTKGNKDDSCAII